MSDPIPECPAWPSDVELAEVLELVAEAQAAGDPGFAEEPFPGTALLVATLDGIAGAVIYDGTDEIRNGSFLDFRALSQARALLGEQLVRALTIQAGL